MSNLTANTPFDGYAQDWDGLSLKELNGFEIVSLAVANGQKLKSKTPEPGHWIENKDGRILWTGHVQYFLFKDFADDRLDEKLSKQLGENVYCTLQTDGWASLEVSGHRIHDVLERFIPLDLRAAPKGFGTRTSAHHMGVIVMKMDEHIYHLLTPRSSSQSFLETLEEVISHVIT